MTLFEKIQLLLLSVLLSVLANLLYRFLNRRNLKKALSQELSLLAENLEGSIINNDATECRPSVEHLITNYGIFYKDKVMASNFRKILGIYTFLRNGGYEKEPSRRENDLQTIKRIRYKLR